LKKKMTDEKAECIFCKIVSKEIGSELLKESDNFIAVKDINPVTEGHTLIIPKKHYVNLMDFPKELGGDLIEFMKLVASDILGKKLGDGFNVVMNNFPSAGQLVPHAHIHLIPRKEGDGIRFLTKV